MNGEKNCWCCPYLKEDGNTVFCMYFRMMRCPKGVGVPNVWQGRPKPIELKPIYKMEEGRIFPPPIVVNRPVHSVMRDNHDQIYKWYYIDGLSGIEIGKRIGTKTIGYVTAYINKVNEFWNWRWNGTNNSE